MHLDLQYGREERDAQVARLEELGATRAYEGHQGPHSWITMRDPEGNEFCVS
ncbi:MAG: VOC family protein [Ilumatobacter sp.]